MAGKGSKQRPTNLLKFRSNFDLIKGFGNKQTAPQNSPVNTTTKKKEL